MKERLKQFKMPSWWQNSINRDRFMLIAIIIGVWGAIKSMELAIPNSLEANLPASLSQAVLAIFTSLLFVHTLFVGVAQWHRRKKPEQLDYKYLPTVDIFISAHNEENVIEATLEELVKHNYPRVKIYPINDRSEDSTVDLMRKVAAKYPDKITVIDRAKDAFPGKAAALNDALLISDAEVVCVFDADARIDEDFLLKVVPYLADPFTGAVQAQKVISNPERNFLVKCQFHEYAMDTYLQIGRDSIRGSVELRGNGELIKRKALEQFGGWNEDTLTDDLDLSTCLHVHGWDIRFTNDARVYEEGVPNMPALLKQRRRWAEGSMRRYLNYFFQLLKPGNLTLNQIFDTLVYIFQFAMPIWVFSDIIFQLVRLYNGEQTYITILMLLGFSSSLVIAINQFMGLTLHKKYNWFKALYYTSITNGYFFFVWMVTIAITYRKILFSRTVGTWKRTLHGA
jgi:1,2-diacylglycerol 3-beta-glucosyltransferase